MAHKHSLIARLRVALYQLYHGQSPAAVRFSYGMLVFDLISIVYFIITSMYERADWFLGIDIAIGVVVLFDFLSRLWLARRKIRYLTSIPTLADIVVIITLFVPVFVENFVFLRVLRALRLMRSFHVLTDLRKRYKFFRMHEEIIQSVLNLTVFLFVVTALVYVVQEKVNPHIDNYLDALYFTVTTLTTTGFGDITLVGTTGKILSVVIMVVGISLFLRLVQTIFRPSKIKYTCPTCGLNRHDRDAVHCKHCGELLKIETEGV